jgi:hypothetical protein
MEIFLVCGYARDAWIKGSGGVQNSELRARRARVWWGSVYEEVRRCELTVAEKVEMFTIV